MISVANQANARPMYTHATWAVSLPGSMNSAGNGRKPAKAHAVQQDRRYLNGVTMQNRLRRAREKFNEALAISQSTATKRPSEKMKVRPRCTTSGAKMKASHHNCLL